MTCQKLNLDLDQGEDKEWIFTILNSGVVENLTGCTVEGMVRNGQKRADPLSFSLTCVINTTENKIYVSVAKATTAAITTLGENATDKASTFFYDIELTRANGKTERIIEGKLFIKREITRP